MSDSDDFFETFLDCSYHLCIKIGLEIDGWSRKHAKPPATLSAFQMHHVNWADRVLPSLRFTFYEFSLAPCDVHPFVCHDWSTFLLWFLLHDNQSKGRRHYKD